MLARFKFGLGIQITLARLETEGVYALQAEALYSQADLAGS